MRLTLAGWRPRILFLIAGAVVVLSYAIRPARRTGDGFEYLYTLQAWTDHATPDLRPDDLDRFEQVLDRANMRYELRNDRPYKGFLQARDGRYYSLHFWMYPLTAVPAKLSLRLLGGNEMAALQTTNAALFVLALYITLFVGGGSPAQRALLAGLAAISPAVWHLEWTTPEAFTWAFALMSVSLLWARRYGWAAACASFGAMHNPPLVILAFFVVCLSLRERSWRVFMLAGAGGLLAFLPNAFNLAHFGRFNLIMAAQAVDFRLIGWPRLHSFLFDLNQGVLPYAPGLILLVGVALARIARRRDGEGMGAVALVLAVIGLCLTQRNWNHGAAGPVKYAVWCFPLLAWVAVRYGPPAGPAFRRFAAAAILLQAAIVFSRDGRERYLEHTWVARFMLERVPSLYNPDVEIFGERQIRIEGYYWNLLPIPFVRDDGRVTKILADSDSLADIGEWFDVEPGYLSRIERRHGAREGMFYLNPPRGAVTAPPLDEGPSLEEFRDRVRLEFAQGPTRTTQDRILVQVRVVNESDAILWGAPSGAPHRFGLVSRIAPPPGGRSSFGYVYPMPYMIPPGTARVVGVDPFAPTEPGDHVIEIAPVLEGLAMGGEPLRLLARVERPSPTEFIIETYPLHDGDRPTSPPRVAGRGE